MPSPTSHQQTLAALLAPIVADAGYYLDDLSISPAGRRSLIRITVDGEDGISLDAVAKLSRAISESLDAAEASGAALLPGAYVLEVSSPGVDRPLTLARHWRRNVGRLVQTASGGAPVSGRVVAATEAEVVIKVGSTERSFALADLAPGKVQVEFGRPSGPDDGIEDELDEDELDEDELDEDDEEFDSELGNDLDDTEDDDESKDSHEGQV